MNSTITTLGLVGIDKSNLTTRDFRLKDSMKLNHKPPTRLAVNPKLLVNKQDIKPIQFGVDLTGRELTGSYYLQTKSGVVIDVDSKGLKLNLNPSRVIRKNDPAFIVTSRNELTLTRDIVQRELDHLGLEVDLLSMNVCRLDPCKQVNMIDLASRYQSVGTMISASRVKGLQYETAFQLGNTQRQFIYYSKHSHMLANNQESSNPHLGRAELKLLNSKVVKSTLGISTYKSLIDFDPDQLSCEFHNVVNSLVFSNKVDPLTLEQVNYTTELSLYDTYYKGLRNGHNKYLSDLGCRCVVEHFGSVSNFGNLLDQVGIPRSTRYRVISQMKDQVQRLSVIDNKRERMTTLDKYNELQRNFGIAV